MGGHAGAGLRCAPRTWNDTAMKTLILVDLQNDFLPGGPLAVPMGNEVVPVANRLMSQYDMVVATQDWHPANHCSFASQHPGHKPGDIIDLNGVSQVLWPDHCVQTTRGADFAPGLNMTGVQWICHKGTDPGIDSYSGFFDNGRLKQTGLSDYLRKRGVQEVHIMGLATDYCVKFTALDARELGFQTHLIVEGVRGVELHPGDCAKAIEEMQAAGVQLVTVVRP